MPTPPIRIGLQDNTDSSSDFGPFSIGGAWYAVGQQTTGAIDVYKSLDGGATWAVQDTFNAPETNGGESILRVGPLIKVLSITSGGDYVVTVFNAASDTWGAASAGFVAGVSGLGGRRQVARLVEVASGDLFAFYLVRTNNAPVEIDVRYRVLSAGAWSAAVVLISGTPGPLYHFLHSAIVDTNDLIHVFFKANTNGTFRGALQHFSLTAGGSMSVPDTVDPNVLLWFQAGHAAISGPSILVPYFDSSEFAGVWRGTPLAAPVWTFEPVDSISWPAGVSDGGGLTTPVTAFAFVDGGLEYLVWQATNGSSGGYSVNAVYYASNDGSGWSDPVLAYDEVTDPGAWYGTNDPDLAAISAAVIDGAVASVSNINCEGIAWLPSSALCDVTVTPASLPAAAQGRPYTSPVILASDNGGVGQDFAYEITIGALPPQMFMVNGTTRSRTGPTNSTSGVHIAGTPTHTAWTGPITYQFGVGVRLVQ